MGELPKWARFPFDLPDQPKKGYPQNRHTAHITKQGFRQALSHPLAHLLSAVPRAGYAPGVAGELVTEVKNQASCRNIK